MFPVNGPYRRPDDVPSAGYRSPSMYYYSDADDDSCYSSDCSIEHAWSGMSRSFPRRETGGGRPYEMDDMPRRSARNDGGDDESDDPDYIRTLDRIEARRREVLGRRAEMRRQRIVEMFNPMNYPTGPSGRQDNSASPPARRGPDYGPHYGPGFGTGPNRGPVAGPHHARYGPLPRRRRDVPGVDCESDGSCSSPWGGDDPPATDPRRGGRPGRRDHGGGAPAGDGPAEHCPVGRGRGHRRRRGGGGGGGRGRGGPQGGAHQGLSTWG